jgi:hypothetical protein
MKKLILALSVLTILISSCGRALSPSEAASKNFKHCRALK